MLILALTLACSGAHLGQVLRGGRGQRLRQLGVAGGVSAAAAAARLQERGRPRAACCHCTGIRGLRGSRGGGRGGRRWGSRRHARNCLQGSARGPFKTDRQVRSGQSRPGWELCPSNSVMRSAPYKLAMGFDALKICTYGAAT